MKTLIHDGRDFMEPDHGLELLIENGRILAAGADLDRDDVDELIDAGGALIAPGWVDLRSRITTRREALAAAHRGITTAIIPPDGHPGLDDPVELRDLLGQLHSGCRVRAVAALTAGLAGEGLSDMAALVESGAIAVGNGSAWVNNALVMRCAMQYAKDLGLTVFITPRDPNLCAGGSAHAGRVATRLGLGGIPAAAETAALARDLALVEDLGVRAHFGPLSCAASVELVERARKVGLEVTADTAIHHLFLTDLDLIGFDPNCHVDPPLRDQTDRDALRDAVARGVLMLTSDHRPLNADDKTAPFGATVPGIAGLDTLLPLGMRLVEDGACTRQALVKASAIGPGAVLGDVSGLAVGSSADLILIDPLGESPCRPGDDGWQSRGMNTPFAGWSLPDLRIRTMIAGEWVA